jgi:uncharacterized protein YdeI (YjbR/CyaY-like superfamily)
MQSSKKDSEVAAPKDLSKVLKEVPSVISIWESLTPIARRDFITWIDGAKQTETRIRRIRIAREKLIQGERRPCCYAVVPMNLYKALGNNPKAKAVWKTLTPDERRDFVSYLNDAQNTESRMLIIEKICTMLVNGKKYR